MKRLLPALLLFFALFALLCLPARAEEDRTLALLPEDYTGTFTKDGHFALPDLASFLELLVSSLKTQLRESGADLALFLGATIACGIFSIFQQSFARAGDGPLGLSLTLAGCLMVYGAFKGVYGVAQTHLNALCRLLSSFIPAVTASAAAMGGVSSAAISGAGLAMILSFIGQFSLGVLFPLQKTVFALDLTAEIARYKPLSAFSRGLRTLFLTLLGVVSALLSGVFALQNVIAAKSDSLSLRAFRFTVGSALPLVGSVFSESSKTLLSSLSLIRSSVGAAGVCMILLLFLPTLILLLCARLVLVFSASFAASLEASPADKLFSAGASAVGGLCAALSLSDLCAIVALASTMYTAV